MAGARVRAGLRDVVLIALTMGIGLATLIGLFLGTLVWVAMSFPPAAGTDWLRNLGDSGMLWASIGGALVYGTVAGGIGALIGGWLGRRG